MLRVGCFDGSTHALSSSQGLWQSGCKASSLFRIPFFMLEHVMGAPEPGPNSLKPFQKAVEMATKPQRDMQVSCAGSNQSARWPKFEGQIAEFESFQSKNLSKFSQNASVGDGVDSIQTSEGSCESPSSEACSSGLHIPIELLSESKCNEDSLHTSHVLQSHIAHNDDDGFPGNISGLTGRFLENQQVNAGIQDSRKPLIAASHPVVGFECSSHSSEAHDCDGGEVLLNNDEVTEVSVNAGFYNGGKHARQLCGDIQHVDKEHDDCHDSFAFYNQGIKTTDSCVDVQMPRSTNVSILAPEDRQDARVEDRNNEDADALKLSNTGTGVESSIDASSSSSITATLRLPAYRTPTQVLDTLSDSVAYFESLGVDWRSVFQVEPGLSCCMVEQIRAMVSALESYGLKWTDTGRLFNICPKILLLEPEKNLKAVINFLFDEAGIPPTDFRRLVKRCPRLLVADIKTQLRPTLSFLRSLGYPKMGHTIAKNPCLLSFDVKTRLIPRLRLLESWGFTYREAAAIAVRFPAIFNYSETGNLRRKYEYLKEEMGGGKEDLLAFPQFFGYSLEWRIRPRHQSIVNLNVTLSIQAMLTMPDAEFSARFLCADEQDNVPKRDSLYQSIKKKLHECDVKSLKCTNLESAETPVLISALAT